MKYSTCVRGARCRLGGSAPNSDTRSIMISAVSSMGGNVGDGKGGDVGDNGGMACGVEVSIDV